MIAVPMPGITYENMEAYLGEIKSGKKILIAPAEELNYWEDPQAIHKIRNEVYEKKL